ncbi:SDR family NAD(P)-dependent oxidoreductase [Salinarimonas ramus]|uniref:Oxidoreductase n=1 Tax=Salinarimonas ramus TaxID=690164 RepID=A0A917Q3D0_9HYPH|nr:SDR family oxidoreductase [Salinarimonas ramus]GGK19511.1 oxidoreductase [Salinarimonas ramus]
MPNTRWTIVTGASSGIGAEIARQFSKIGHNLVLVARRREKLEALARELTSADRGFVEVIELDLGRADAPEALHRAVADKGIVVHTLVNNAGFGLRGDFVDLGLDEQVAMIELNVTNLTRLSRLFLPDMIGRGQGGILNVASLAAFQAGPHMAVYYATKAYVLSLSEALHEEAKPFGVTVTALCPGATESEFGARAGMEGSRLFRSGRMDATKVAKAGVEAYRAGHAVSTPGAQNKLVKELNRLLPRAIMRRAAGAMQA